MGALTDFFQSASNAVASNVSAPVDGISWLMRKAGFDPGPAPVGGSDWMRNHGLTADVAPGVANMLGETAGMLTPFAAAAKAPQIAKAFLQGADNLAAPAALNKQAGAVVWHGSPHKFDAFDSSKIGTGEGAQAYGHGLYLADSSDVAKSYANANMGRAKAFDGFLEGLPPGAQTDAYNLLQSKVRGSVGDARLNAIKPDLNPAQFQQLKTMYSGGDSSLYKVDLPDEHIAKMLDWDAPLSAQHPDVQAALQANGVSFSSDFTAINAAKEKADKLQGLLADNKRIAAWYDDFAGPKPFRAMDARISQAQSNWTEANRKGGEIYNQLGGNGGASDVLQKAGIPGIRYLDGGSRATGGTSNYVVFPGNEGVLTILERNGEGILPTK